MTVATTRAKVANANASVATTSHFVQRTSSVAAFACPCRFQCFPGVEASRRRLEPLTCRRSVQAEYHVLKRVCQYPPQPVVLHVSPLTRIHNQEGPRRSLLRCVQRWSIATFGRVSSERDRNRSLRKRYAGSGPLRVWVSGAGRTTSYVQKDAITPIR